MTNMLSTLVIMNSGVITTLTGAGTPELLTSTLFSSHLLSIKAINLLSVLLRLF